MKAKIERVEKSLSAVKHNIMMTLGSCNISASLHAANLCLTFCKINVIQPGFCQVMFRWEGRAHVTTN